MVKKYSPVIFLVGVILIAFGYLTVAKTKNVSFIPTPASTPHPSPSPTPTPTPKPLTFAEMNALYGPCVYLPTLMYHHVQDPQVAKDRNQTNLNVDTAAFREQMQYLKLKGYRTANMAELVNFFNGGARVPAKSVLLTFDDGYDDFYLNAWPILKEFGFTATVFVPTGLVGGWGYLSWDQIGSAAGQGIGFANHTVTHKNVKAIESVLVKEIGDADATLTGKGLNNPKVFAYPYGFSGSLAEKLLAQYGYQLAFTTTPGSALCKLRKFDLPRVRIGNGALSRYGL